MLFTRTGVWLASYFARRMKPLISDLLDGLWNSLLALMLFLSGVTPSWLILFPGKCTVSPTCRLFLVMLRLMFWHLVTIFSRRFFRMG